MDYPTLIDRLTDRFRRDDRALGLWLADSRGRGEADAHGDVDTVICAEPDRLPCLCDDIPTMVEEVATTVHSQQLTDRLFHFITDDWLRYDIAVVTPAELAGRSRDGLAVRFDHRGPHAALPAAGADSVPQAERVSRLTREFPRGLGLLPVVIGRGEYAMGVAGYGLAYGQLIQLLREASTVPDRGGMLGLRRLVTDSTYQAVVPIPPVSATRQSLIDAHRACAAVFIPVARALHRQCGIEWPQAMWDALARHWQARLGTGPE